MLFHSAASARHAPAVADSLEAELIKARVRARLWGKSSPVRLDRFELVRSLGQGGEGMVYEARDLRSGAWVALKQLHPAYTARGGSLKREFRSLADLVHPNLVTLHELFYVEGQRFYTMALVRGVDLVTHVRADAAARHAPLRAALPQLFAGLEALHAAGKLHRDLKPSNVLVDDDGHLVILDYGLVHDERGEELLAGEPTACTPAYAAPEQMRGRPVSASDLYAVGVMMYLALTDRLPFEGSLATPEQTRAGHADPLPPRAIVCDVPVDLDMLCMALLARDPTARPTARAARAFCLGDRAALRAPSPMAASRAERFVGRGPLLAALHAEADGRKMVPLMALLHGESGIGKTSLMRRFCADRAAAGALVLQGRCYEREHLPYKALDAIVERLVFHFAAQPDACVRALSPTERAAVARLFPVFERLRSDGAIASGRTEQADAGDVRQRAFAALKTLFRCLARERELVFAIDDLQWGDLDSIAFLQYLLAGADAPPILLVGVTRTDELDKSEVVVGWRRVSDMGVRSIERAVGPLSDDDAAALLQGLLPASSPHTASLRDACIEQACGVPFALLSLAEHARDAGLSARRHGLLGEVVRLRAQRCSDEARALLDVLVVAGRPLETSLALESAGADPAAFHAATELCGKKLARWRESDAERCLEPYHDLVRGAVSENLEPARARRIHRSIVGALSTRSADRPEHQVEHLLGAEEFELAGLTALRAAERATAQLAWNRAVDLLLIAVRVLGRDVLIAHDAYEWLARALSAANRHREAAAAYEVAARHAARDAERRRIEALAAQQELRAGDHAAGIRRIERLLREVGYRLPKGKVAVLLTYLSQRLYKRVAEWSHGDPTTDLRDAESAMRMQVLSAAYGELWVHEPMYASLIHAWAYRESLKARDRYWLRAIAAEVAQLATVYGPKAEPRVAKLLASANTMEGSIDAPYERAFPLLARAMHALYCRWRPRESLALATTADDLLVRQCPGSFFERSWVASLRAFSFELIGDFDLVRETHEAQDRARTHDDGYSNDQRLMYVPLMLLLQDRPHDAIDFAHTQRSLARGAMVVDYTVSVRLVNAYLYLGQSARAHACLMDVWRRLRRSALSLLHMVSDNARFQRTRVVTALYTETRAQRLKRYVARRVARASDLAPVARAPYHLLAASLARADGHDHACRAALSAAIADSVPDGAGATEWCARYRLAQLDGDSTTLTAAQAWFQARGVLNPERWVSMTAPWTTH